MRAVYRQFLIAQDKDTNKIPRAGVLPIHEMQRWYDQISEKNGDPQHDAAFDLFKMQEREVHGVYYLDGASCESRDQMCLPADIVLK